MMPRNPASNQTNSGTVGTPLQQNGFQITMWDIENNSGGTRIERLSLPGDPDLGDPLAASYNDIEPTKGVKVTNATPDSVTDPTSGPGFYSWTGNSGDTDFTDIWARLPDNAVTGTLEVLCVDLEVSKSVRSRVDRNGKITWRVRVTNNGRTRRPSARHVLAAAFAIALALGTMALIAIY